MGDREIDVFSEVVFSVEKMGKPVKLLALSGTDWQGSLLEAASVLDVSDIWIGASENGRQGRQESSLQESWKALGPQKRSISILMVTDLNQEPKELCLSKG